ncbi:MAG TPA: hypothetical protein VH639_02080 [Bryobacteraceae bacterium]
MGLTANPPFWFLLILGAIGLWRIPRNERGRFRFRFGIACWLFALAGAAFLAIAGLIA